jgi:hypothetical protein
MHDEDTGSREMKTIKTQESFVDYGCGFPVVIKDVPLVQVRGVWTPDIDYNELHKNVLLKLARNPEQLTGNQIKFVRHYFSLTLAEFGEYFDVSHPAVLKWEKAGDDAPSIKWSLERDLRMFIMDRLGEDSATIGRLYRDLRSKAAAPTRRELFLGVLPEKSDVVFNDGLTVCNSNSLKAFSPVCTLDDACPPFNHGLFSINLVGHAIQRGNEYTQIETRRRYGSTKTICVRV